MRVDFPDRRARRRPDGESESRPMRVDLPDRRARRRPDDESERPMRGSTLFPTRSLEGWGR
jgi:hypothetical protein